jgi:hypothetical protein
VITQSVQCRRKETDGGLDVNKTTRNAGLKLMSRLKGIDESERLREIVPQCLQRTMLHEIGLITPLGRASTLKHFETEMDLKKQGSRRASQFPRISPW